MRKASGGVVPLNTYLQTLLNPAAPEKAELTLPKSHSSAFDDRSSPVVLREGDRVIQCSNNYQKDVFNGDIGFVTKVNKATRELSVQYQGGSAGKLTGQMHCSPVTLQRLWLRKFCDKALERPQLLTTSVWAADKEVAYKGAELNDVQLAWATTIHKAQGSECPVVVLVMSPHHRTLLSRRLLYTGLLTPIASPCFSWVGQENDIFTTPFSLKWADAGMLHRCQTLSCPLLMDTFGLVGMP